MTSTSDKAPRFNSRSLIIVGLVAIPCFAIAVSNPFNIAPAWPSAGVSYASAILYAPISALILYAGFKVRNMLGSDDGDISPGQFIVVGLALLVIYGLAFDLGYAMWLHSGKGIYSKGHFENAWKMVGYGLLAVPLLIAFLRSSLPTAWRRVSLVGGITAAFLAFLGLLEAVTYILIAVDHQFLFETWELLAIPILAGLGNLTLMGWGMAVAVLYARDHWKQTRYNWIHYVPMISCIAGVGVGILTQIGYVLANRY
jgi:hypothetical protein